MGRVITKFEQARLDYQARIGRPVSAQEVAEAVGVTRAAVRKIERNQSWPGRELFEKLCAFYSVSAKDMIDEEWLALMSPMAWTTATTSGLVPTGT